MRPSEAASGSKETSYANGRRWVGAVLFTVVLSGVSDGWSGKPSPLMHQALLLLPAFLLFYALTEVLGPVFAQSSVRWTQPGIGVQGMVLALFFLELWSLWIVAVESAHFRSFGYRLRVWPLGEAGAGLLLGWVLLRSFPATFRESLRVWLVYLAGAFVAIRCFPLNYLRSDMLPVITWADERLVHHLNPYATMHVGTRLYDFPYLPGMLIAYFPAIASGADPRFLNAAYLFGIALLFALSSVRERAVEVAATLGLFLLCPFLQYRHDLYLEPHWFAITLAVVLMQRGRLLLSALVWGLSCAIYQLSWILIPFLLLYGFRRKGLREAAKLSLGTLAGFVLFVGPFLRVAWSRIGQNTVEQWNRLPHALADPINLSFWLTYVIRPSQLRWVQAGLLSALFVFCVLRRRCTSVEDTSRWMVIALAVFIPLNILVDGYFYLTLLLLLMMYMCIANGWWRGSSDPMAGEPHSSA